MIRPSDDPGWEVINPVWNYLPGDKEYELLGTITIERNHGQDWSVKAAVRTVGETEIHRLVFHYASPFTAADVKRNIENYAGKIHWGYNLVNVGPYYE